MAVEFRNLAERSQQSTVHVEDILLDNRHATDHAVITTEECTNTIAMAMADINTTTTGIVESTQDLEKSNADMESIAEELQESVSIYQT